MTTANRLVSSAAVLAALILAQSLAAQPPQPAEPAPPEGVLPPLLKAKPIKVDSKDDELHKLLKERYNEAVGEMTHLYQMHQLGHATLDEVYGAGRRLVKAGLELKEKPEEQAALLRQYVEVMKHLEKLKKAEVEAGRVGMSALHKARYYRIDAEIRLLRLKKK
jgi:hypothetical protein